MILDELVLHNVGTFAGRHCIQLSPVSTRKPIVLIGGLNGAGKTTILEAIHLALYGPLAQASGRRSGSYDNYLRDLIHHGVPQHEGAAVELAFRTHQEGHEREYRVRRTWRSTGSSIREILSVSVGGRHDVALTATWAEQAETFLPRGIAGLFFFDGEQIEALADMDRSREVLRSALAALLGLELVDRLSTDLSVLRRRRRSQQVPDDLRTSVEERQQAVTSLRQAEELGAQAVASLCVEHERAEKRSFELTEQYRTAGGDLLERRDAAEATAAQLRNELLRTEEDLRDEMAGVAPLLQLTTALEALQAQAFLEVEADRQRVVGEIVTQRDVDVLRQLARAGVDADAISSLESFLASDRERRREVADIQSVTALKDGGALSLLLESAIPAAGRRLDTLTERHAQQRAALDEAERVLVAMPDPERLAPLREERDAAAADVIHRRAALTQAEERLASLRQERARADAAYEAALDKAAHANLAADDSRRVVDHIDRVRITLERLRTASTERHLSRISGLVLEALNQLLRKENLITSIAIDPDTHTISLTGSDSRQLSSKELSAGERQLLAVALLWGLAKAAGQPLPIVIDTPLGRLDGSHREHLLDRYFPAASHQVVLLSTDTEIDQVAFDRIAPHVGRSYRLEFDTSTNATAVVPGYFWE